ncbi:antA/AntB antirepressor family protein [Salmonella enterica]|uniref:antA/AntB antirepressor family protein n=1 Tax=Salmonella enterica TaxID=28901 RepID=UPI0012F1B24C|nr:AntA/AntB antirepressor [Salmonella enterica]EBQ9003862.1 AntA/AntB antirepressor [Salmonella enterica subsp. enterica serovar Blockley]ECW2122111.1 AntA/AntB antirepressor [Salmonella enterica]
MTSQLIPVFNGSISNESVLLCDARELHTFLEVGKRFASWITERLTEYGFAENQDYILISQNWETKGRGGDRRSKDYHLTLDTAKELAMVERNEKGRQIRRYFIECEKRLRQQQQSTPSVEEVYTITLTRTELCSLCWTWSAAEYMRETLERVCPGLIALRAPVADSIESMTCHYQETLEAAKAILERETRGIEPRPFAVEDANWRTVLPRLRTH